MDIILFIILFVLIYKLLGLLVEILFGVLELIADMLLIILKAYSKSIIFLVKFISYNPKEHGKDQPTTENNQA